MKKTFLVIAIVLLFAQISIAQTFGGSLMLGSPQGDFRKNVDRLGYGLQVEGTLWATSKERPVSFGLDLGYMVYGEISERRAWPGFPGIYLNLNRTNSLANLHLMLKISPFSGAVKPYVEGLAGGSYLFTTSSVKSENSSEEIASSTNFDDFNFSYGGGGGFLFKLSENLGDVKTLYLDLKVRYLMGSEAEYLTEESVVINNLGDAIFNPKKSKTDIMTFHLGVIAYF